MNAINSIGNEGLYGRARQPGNDFQQALDRAQLDLQTSIAMGAGGRGSPLAIPQGPAMGTATGTMPGFGQWVPVWVYVGAGQPGGGQTMGAPLAAGGCARSNASSCGCAGNLGSQMPTNANGQPLSAFDFRPLAGASAPMPSAPPFLGTMPGGMGPGNMAPGMAPGMAPPGMLPGNGPMMPITGWRPGMPVPQEVISGTNPAGMPSMGRPHMGHGMPGTGHAGGHGGMGGVGHGGMHGMLGHDGHGYYTLDGIGMVHAKDELRRGDHLRDPTFFNRVARGDFGQFSGVSMNVAPNGDLEGQVYISGHPAAFHQLYDQGRRQGLEGDALEQYIAEELTNINNLDDIDEIYWRYWEARGVPRATRDHDLHNTGSIAGVLAPGQTLRLTGAHQFDTLTDPKFNYTAVNSDPSGTFIDFYRLSNNNDPNNGHHEDLVAALRIYLSPDEVRQLASGTKPIDIVNRRFIVSDDTADYRLSPVAIQRMRALGMPIF